MTSYRRSWSTDLLLKWNVSSVNLLIGNRIFFVEFRKYTRYSVDYYVVYTYSWITSLHSTATVMKMTSARCAHSIGGGIAL